MNEKEFNERLQAELFRVNGLNKELQRQVEALQAQNEQLMGTNTKLREIAGPEPKPVSRGREKKWYA